MSKLSKCLLLLILPGMVYTSNAQASYMSKHSAVWKFDYYLGEYEKVREEKVRTRFVTHREWFALEIDDEFIKWEWAYLQNFEYLGECYITEGDHGMACINSKDNIFFVFSEFNEETEQWQLGLVLSDIHKIPAITFKD